MSKLLIFSLVFIHIVAGQHLFRRYDPFKMVEYEQVAMLASSSNPSRKLFVQKLDHFKPSDQKTWSQVRSVFPILKKFTLTILKHVFYFQYRSTG